MTTTTGTLRAIVTTSHSARGTNAQPGIVVRMRPEQDATRPVVAEVRKPDRWAVRTRTEEEWDEVRFGFRADSPTLYLDMDVVRADLAALGYRPVSFWCFAGPSFDVEVLPIAYECVAEHKS